MSSGATLTSSLVIVSRRSLDSRVGNVFAELQLSSPPCVSACWRSLSPDWKRDA